MKISSRVQKIAEYPSATLAGRKKKLKEQGVRLFDFGAGDPIEPTAKFIRDAVTKGVPEVSQYPTVKGCDELIHSIQGYLKRRFDVTLPAKNIIQATGSKEAIYSVAFLLIEPGCEKNIIIGPTPGYFVYERSAIMCGAEYLSFELNEKNNFRMDLATLPESTLKKTAIAWINYPHNPTGAEIDLDYLRTQIEICKKYDILFCSDECYQDMYYGDTTPPSALQVSIDNVLVFHSTSKRSGMTAYRSGFIAGDASIIEVFGNFRNTLGVATPIYTQTAAAAAWGDDLHAEERREIFKKKRALFKTFFKKKGFEYVESDSTFYFWLKSPKGYNGTTYAEKLLEKGLVISPGEFFGKSSIDYYRIALVPSLSDCIDAIELWDSI
jgi:succinyldiaminopimelate transaminase